jgi:hypothetical protein
VTGGWAATNTLREYLDTAEYATEEWRAADDAVAQVEQALEYVDHAEAVISRDPFGEAERKQVAELLAAALRAVREGK